jgi:hypothetical protein
VRPWEHPTGNSIRETRGPDIEQDLTQALRNRMAEPEHFTLVGWEYNNGDCYCVDCSDSWPTLGQFMLSLRGRRVPPRSAKPVLADDEELDLYVCDGMCARNFKDVEPLRI